MADRVFNLEGEVEFGGKLRIVELDSTGWNVIELANCQPITDDANIEKAPVETVEQAVEYLRNNKFVKEKKLGNGISSFNFTREAFYSANWTRQTVLARGLFIDTDNNKIMARSYEKFFKINEVRETEMIALKNRLKFPVKAYVKENGFRLPFAISILNRSMICRYMGVSLLKFHSIISPAFVLLYYLINTIIHVRLFVNYKLISYKNVRYEVEM